MCKEHAGNAHTPHPGYSEDKKKYMDRLSRIAGQVNGISTMVQDDRYCIDILTQISAIQSGLENVALKLLNDHMEHCVREAMESDDPAAAKEKLEELSAAVNRMVKS